MLRPILLFALLLVLLSACEKEPPMNSPNNFTPCESELTQNGQVYQLGDQTMLWAGPDSSMHFNITDWSLRDCQLRDYGFNRETTAALTAPRYIPAQDNADIYQPTEKTIVVYGTQETKVYPYSQMAFYEVINDVVDGAPIMIAYCYLADLAAVYTRIYCDKELTFGVSGYTYADEQVWDGIQAFVLWDRETESLWWPLIDEAVSGHLQGSRLEKHTEAKWGYLTWGEVMEQYPDALTPDPNQAWIPPTEWQRYACGELSCCVE